MTDEVIKERIIIDCGDKARLEWAFTIISQFMLSSKLAILHSKSTGLVVTDINDCVLERDIEANDD